MLFPQIASVTHSLEKEKGLLWWSEMLPTEGGFWDVVACVSPFV